MRGKLPSSVGRPGAGDAGFIAGELCLDFANTADWHASRNPRETLIRYPDLVAWSRRAGMLTDIEARRLLRIANQRPADGERVRTRAIALREALYRIFHSLARHERPRPGDVRILNDALAEAQRRLCVIPAGNNFTWSWRSGEAELDRMLWPIACSAAGLLTSADAIRVGQCADDRGCGWLFLDTSKNRSRRWCAMGDCGNRAKAHRHFLRCRDRRSRARDGSR